MTLVVHSAINGVAHMGYKQIVCGTIRAKRRSLITIEPVFASGCA